HSGLVVSPSRSLPSTPGLADPAVTVLLVVLGVIFVLPKVLRIYRERKKLIKALEAFPGPPRHWLYGHNHLVRTELGSAGVALSQKLHKMLILLWSLFCFTDPKSNIPYKYLAPWIGQGLLTLNGTKWSQHWKLLTPAFHYDLLKSYVALMSDSVNVMLDKWEKTSTQTKSVELFQDISLMTLDNIMKCAFSSNTDCQTQRSVHEPPNSGRTIIAHQWKTQKSRPPGVQDKPRPTRWPQPSTVSPVVPPKRSLTLWFAFREDLGKMTYTTMCIKESLRLFPPVPLLSRQLSTPVTFSDGRSLPAGPENLALLVLGPMPTMRPLLLPQVYDPLRFSPENSAQRHSHAFLPFSAGYRCENLNLHPAPSPQAALCGTPHPELCPQHP
uniref:Uncharacterized protein n=1 Tax=Anser brachyrhynchus TaxID=132585 RepID=A0A8B9CIM3_9AVES